MIAIHCSRCQAVVGHDGKPEVAGRWLFTVCGECFSRDPYYWEDVQP